MDYPGSLFGRQAAVCTLLALLMGFGEGVVAESATPIRRPRGSSATNGPVSAKVLARSHPTEALKSWIDQLPKAPAGVSDLRFDEIFRNPIGPKGLEFSPRLLELAGQRVRILGYQVKQSRPTPWTLMLAPMPLVSNEVEFGLAEDLPPTVVRVLLPRGHQPLTPHSNGLFLLTGRLEVGDREEPDGRHSLVRLHLDRDNSTSTASTPEIRGETAPTNPLSASEGLRR